MVSCGKHALLRKDCAERHGYILFHKMLHIRAQRAAHLRAKQPESPVVTFCKTKCKHETLLKLNRCAKMLQLRKAPIKQVGGFLIKFFRFRLASTLTLKKGFF